MSLSPFQVTVPMPRIMRLLAVWRVFVVGQLLYWEPKKGSTTEQRVKRNFGMVRPEGYRKASRLRELANQFNLPVISFVDTAGAYPGRGAEERGQAEAIARLFSLVWG